MATETMDAAVPAIRDADMVALQALLPHLATKADLAGLATKAEVAELATKVEVAELRTGVERLRTDMAGVQALLPHLATKADLADLRADLADLRTEIHAAMNALTWKLAGALLAGLTALAGLIVALQIFAT